MLSGQVSRPAALRRQSAGALWMMRMVPPLQAQAASLGLLLSRLAPVLLALGSPPLQMCLAKARADLVKGGASPVPAGWGTPHAGAEHSLHTLCACWLSSLRSPVLCLTPRPQSLPPSGSEKNPRLLCSTPAGRAWLPALHRARGGQLLCRHNTATRRFRASSLSEAVAFSGQGAKLRGRRPG